MSAPLGTLLEEARINLAALLQQAKMQEEELAYSKSVGVRTRTLDELHQHATAGEHRCC